MKKINKTTYHSSQTVKKIKIKKRENGGKEIGAHPINRQVSRNGQGSRGNTVKEYYLLSILRARF